jgi:hypothetical protein
LNLLNILNILNAIGRAGRFLGLKPPAQSLGTRLERFECLRLLGKGKPKMLSKSIYAVAIACLIGGLGSPGFSQQPVKNFFKKCFGPNCQQSAGFVVGQADVDGAIINWVGPVADPVPSMVVTPVLAPSLPAEASILAKRSDFRQVFLKALRQARDKGEISAFEHGRLVVASLRPRELANIQAWVHENAIQEGLASAQAPDWNAIIDFIERLIPLIIKLIDLFGSNSSASFDFQYAINSRSPEVRTQCDWTWIGLAV